VNPLLAGLGLTVCYVAGLMGWRMARRPADAAERFGSLSRAGLDVERPSLLRRTIGFLGHRLANRALPLLGDKRVALIRHRLDAAGRPMTLETYAGQKAAWTVLLGGLGLLLALLAGNVLLIPLLGFVGWLGVDLSLAGLAKRRQAQIDRDLPDFLDILAVIVNAGSGFRPALARVADALGGPLAEEVHLTLRQMDLGASRRAAFTELRERNDSETLGTLVSSLLQAEELGSPLTDVLADIAMDMRREFQQTARRKASQAAPRISLIVTTIIIPGAVVLIVTALFVASGIDAGDFLG
jgi:tight adherence protein C